MLQSEFNSLKKGDKVIYTFGGNFGSFPPKGTVLTRDPSSWLDDDVYLNFTYIGNDGLPDHHFFNADEVELIKE